MPVKDKISALISKLDSVISSIDKIMDVDFKKNLGGTLSNFNKTSESLNRIIVSKETDIKSTLENFSKFTQMLSDNSGKMDKTFGNLKVITDTLASADIYTSVSNLKASLEKAATMMNNLNNGKGSAGQFLTNDSLYINLTHSLGSLNDLLKDMKANPKKYVHFSLFGK
jgi:phospholipid/cholesterol/gamma-HCH transport system substrate-binding protein